MNAYAWMSDNAIVVSLALYVVLNIMRRIPPPSDTRLLFVWELVERFMFLTWEAMPGKLRLPGTSAFDDLLGDNNDTKE